MKNKNLVGEVAEEVKALAANSDDLSSIPGVHMAEGEKRVLQISSVVHTQIN